MRRGWWLLPLAVLLTGAKRDRPVPGACPEAGEPAATVNGHPIPGVFVDQLAAEVAEGDPERALSILVDIELLYQDALTRGLHRRDEGRAALALAERQALAELALEARVDDALTPERVRRAWEEDPRFHEPQVRVSHLLVDTEDAARAARAAIEAGRDFEAVAREVSEDPSVVVNGGDLGWVGRGLLVPAFEGVAFTTARGELGGPLETEYGWHVLRVADRREELPFAEARDELQATLRDALYGEVLDRVRASAEVVRPDQPYGAVTTPVEPIPPHPGDLAIGPPDADVTVVMYSDVQCPYCADAWTRVRALSQATGVRVVYRHYPLDPECNDAVENPLHPLACEAARALVCSPRVETLETLFRERQAFDAARVRAIAGSDPATSACLDAPETTATLAAHLLEGRRLGVEGTPSFFVGAGATWLHVRGGVDDLGRVVAALRKEADGR